MQTEIHRQHKDIKDVSFFDMPIKRKKDPTVLLANESGEYIETKMDNQVIIYRPDTMDILGRSRSNNYKLVEPTKLYSEHAKQLSLNSELPTDVIIDDYVYEGGRKQKRTITYPTLTKRMNDGSNVAMRSDIFNSVDMSWVFQAFVGAYRDLCRNSLVFGGQRMFHTKRKHTKGLEINSILKNIKNTFTMFKDNQVLMQKMMERKITLEQAGHILANSVAKKHSESGNLGIEGTVTVNQKLLDYLLHQIRKESGSLGMSVWNLFNALTYWSTHIEDTWEQENDKGILKEYRTSRKGSKLHTAQVKREDKVREFLNTTEFDNLLRGVYLVPINSNFKTIN